MANGDAPAPTYPEHLQQWHLLCQEYPYLNAIADRWGNEPGIPEAMKSGEFLRLLGTLQREPYRSILQHLLFALLADGVQIMIDTAREGGDE